MDMGWELYNNVNNFTVGIKVTTSLLYLVIILAEYTSLKLSFEYNKNPPYIHTHLLTVIRFNTQSPMLVRIFIRLIGGKW